MAYKNCCKCSIPDYWQQVSQGFRKFLRGWKANDATDNRRSKSNPIPALALLLIHWQSNHTILVYQDQSFPQVTLTCFFLSFTMQIQN